MRPMAGWSRYSILLPTLRDNSLFCFGAGEYNGAYVPFTRRRLPSHGLIIVSNGSGTYTGSELTSPRQIGAPTAISLFPGVEHGYGPHQSGWTEHWVLFGGRSAIALEELGVLDRERPIRLLDRSVAERAVSLFRELRAQLDNGGVRGRLHASLLAQQIILLAASHLEDRHEDGGPLPVFASLACVPMSMTERAQRVGMSVAELRKLVRMSHGVTPAEYVTQLRIARAQQLLTDTAMSIAQVGWNVGYEDAAYFSRVFSQRVGQPPSVFRVQQRRSLARLGGT